MSIKLLRTSDPNSIFVEKDGVIIGSVSWHVEPHLQLTDPTSFLTFSEIEHIIEYVRTYIATQEENFAMNKIEREIFFRNLTGDIKEMVVKEESKKVTE